MFFITKRELIEENERLEEQLKEAKLRIRELEKNAWDFTTLEKRLYDAQGEIHFLKDANEEKLATIKELREQLERERGEYLERIADAHDSRCETLEQLTAFLLTLKDIATENLEEATADVEDSEESGACDAFEKATEEG